MAGNAVNWTYVAVATANAMIAVSGWVYASKTQDSRAKRQAKNSESGRLIDKVEELFDSLVEHINDDWDSDEAIRNSYQKRVAMISKLRFLMIKIHEVDSSLPSIDHDVLKDLRKLLTNDVKASNLVKNQAVARVISNSERLLTKYSKKFD
ncbi:MULTISPECIES: hypothetical protein [unclassified Vibrio]|uniref:hypothetical protein n=1 Tax=unclassified Vibrio TaxID=2614977 RepID=UPI00352C402D